MSWRRDDSWWSSGWNWSSWGRGDDSHDSGGGWQWQEEEPAAEEDEHPQQDDEEAGEEQDGAEPSSSSKKRKRRTQSNWNREWRMMKENHERRVLAEARLDVAVTDMEQMAEQALRDSESIVLLNSANYYAVMARNHWRSQAEKSDHDLRDASSRLRSAEAELQETSQKLRVMEDKRLRAESEVMRLRSELRDTSPPSARMR